MCFIYHKFSVVFSKNYSTTKCSILLYNIVIYHKKYLFYHKIKYSQELYPTTKLKLDDTHDIIRKVCKEAYVTDITRS